MKKMFFGALLYSWGLLSILLLINLAINNPVSYNDIEGFRAFLLTYNLGFFFLVCVILTLVGLGICAYEAFKVDTEENK